MTRRIRLWSFFCAAAVLAAFAPSVPGDVDENPPPATQQQWQQRQRELTARINDLQARIDSLQHRVAQQQHEIQSLQRQLTIAGRIPAPPMVIPPPLSLHVPPTPEAPRGAVPFQFNGSTVYVVPLDSSQPPPALPPGGLHGQITTDARPYGPMPEPTGGILLDDRSPQPSR